MKKFVIYRLLIVVWLTPAAVLAQQKDEWGKDREDLETVEIDVVGDKEIKLPNAARIFVPVPPQAVTRAEGGLEYSFKNFTYQGKDVPVSIRPKTIKSKAESKLYGNYLRAGFGNYLTPYLEAFLANKRQKEYSYGAHVNFLNSFRGPVDGKNSASGIFSSRLFGNVYGDKAVLAGAVDYQRDNWRYYGYPEGDTTVVSEDIKQFFNRVRFSGEARSSEPENDFQYLLKAGLNNISDNYGASETNVYADLFTSLEVLENVKVLTGGGVNYLSRKNEADDVVNRMLITGDIAGLYEQDNFSVQAGLDIAYFNDTLGGNNGFKLYPQGKARYYLGKKFEVFAAFGGGVELNTLMGLTEENPFVHTDAYIANTTKPMAFSLGASGNINNVLGLNAGMEYSRLKNAYFYANSLIDTAKFELVYDSGGVSLFNPYASIQFNKDELYRATFRADYYGYNMGSLQAPWHRPEYRVSLDAKFNIGNKIIVGADLYFLGGIKARDNLLQEKKLDPVIDLNFGLEYLVGPRFTVFIDLNNILGNNYMLYDRYKVKGFQAMAGVSYRF